LGKRVHAIVQTSHPITEAELLEHLADRLVRYKIPRTVEFSDVALRDDAGKVRRSAISEAVAGREAGSNA
jgi:bile acid-coenzyme A ligase